MAITIEDAEEMAQEADNIAAKNMVSDEDSGPERFEEGDEAIKSVSMNESAIQAAMLKFGFERSVFKSPEDGGMPEGKSPVVDFVRDVYMAEKESDMSAFYESKPDKFKNLPEYWQAVGTPDDMDFNGPYTPDNPGPFDGDKLSKNYPLHYMEVSLPDTKWASEPVSDEIVEAMSGITGNSEATCRKYAEALRQAEAQQDD